MAGEPATSVGFSAALALIDIAMAFEHIRKMGVKRGFPLRLLRFLIGAHRVPKFLLVEDVHT